jgi:hypothetical protein
MYIFDIKIEINKIIQEEVCKSEMSLGTCNLAVGNLIKYQCFRMRVDPIS